MMNSSCLPPILNLKVGKNKTKKKKNRKKKLYVREVNHNRCPRDSQPLCARTSSVCDSLQVGESRCSSSMHGRRGWPVCLSPWRISYRHFTKACLFSSWSNSAAGIDDLRRLHPQVLAALITWQWKTLRVKAQTTTWGGGDYWGMRHPHTKLQPWNPENNWCRVDCGLCLSVCLLRADWGSDTARYHTNSCNCTMFDHSDIWGQTFIEVNLQNDLFMIFITF